MSSVAPDPYAILGLDHRCTDKQIRDAYRILARQHHPDLNPNSPDAVARIQAINAAYQILNDPDQRASHDRDRERERKSTSKQGASAHLRNISRDVHVRIEELIRGTALEVCVNDPGNPGGVEQYDLTIPPETAPGTRFKLARNGGGNITVRIRAQAGFQLKVKGSDLCCDLRISSQRAAQGGEAAVTGACGKRLRVHIARGVTRGEKIRVQGEGLPRSRGGRGDLIVRILYQPEVTVRRHGGR